MTAVIRHNEAKVKYNKAEAISSEVEIPSLLWLLGITVVIRHREAKVKYNKAEAISSPK
ncbi:MAG: hypothetical protein JWO32_1141 [Bacteroidetes bacterium]|nr:hypothetical protein [Bacteroidota bacterium]